MLNFKNISEEWSFKSFLSRNIVILPFLPFPYSLFATAQITCKLNSAFNGPTLPFCHPLASSPLEHKLLKPNESIIASDKDFDSGTIGKNNGPIKDAFDLYLIKRKNGDYILVPFMKIQFIFEDSANFQWTLKEKITFVDKFKSQIDKVWGNRKKIKKLNSGKLIFIEHRFDTWVAGETDSEHWEIYVKKIKRGSFSQSFVKPISKEVHLDSEDINSVYKGHNQYQRGVVHEFGHMIGLPDEYLAGSKYNQDYQTIMNRGETVLDRHRNIYMDWLEKTLKRNKIN